jgi:predicted MFS family arabinose efflux permease
MPEVVVCCGKVRRRHGFIDMKKNRLLFLCSFLFSLSSNILGLSFVYLLTDRFSFNPGGVGAYVAMGSFAYFLGCNIYHRTQGRPWRVIPVAVSVTFVSSVLLAQVRDYRVVAVCYILVQGSTGLYWPPVMAWFTQGLGEAALNRDISVFNRRWFILVQGGLVFCALAFVLAGSRIGLYFVVVILYGLVNSCCYSNSIFYSSATGKNPRKNLALHEIFLSIGSTCGALGGGFCYQRLGFSGAFLVVALFLGLGLGAFVLLNNREKPA